MARSTPHLRSRAQPIQRLWATIGGEAARDRLWYALRSTAVAAAVVIGTIWVAMLIGEHVEGHVSLFAKLETNLVAITLLALPLLFLTLYLRLLERVRSLRLKLFIACLVGQIAALAATYVAANNSRAMPFKPPYDGLFIILLVYAAALSLSLAFLLAGSLTALLARIRHAAARIADGDLTTRIAIDTHDELAELAGDLNMMAARLNEAARRERQMEQSRRELIAAVSHDLRTPLAAIRATIEAILDGVVSDEETVRRYLQTMRDNTGVLSSLINDLFELSRIESGALTLMTEPTALGDLVSDLLGRMRPRAAEAGVTLCGEDAPDLPLVPLDAQQIGRVLANLVDNALRHTPPGGTVAIALQRDPGSVQVEVRDSGEGVAPADLPHIFERFYRGERSRSREHGGAGLGLAISKGIVEAHGGTIWAEPLQPSGTRVCFTLPLTAPRRPTA